MFRSIKESLVEIFEGDKLSNAYKIGGLEILWSKTVGSNVNKNTNIKHFKNGVLTIKTKTPVWRNELQFQKKDIISKLNQKLDKNKIKDIRFL